MKTNPVNFVDLVPELDKDQQKAIDAINNINLIYDSPLDDDKRKNMITDVVVEKAFKDITDVDARAAYLAGILDHFLAHGMNEIAQLEINEEMINNKDLAGEFDINKITDLPEVVVLISNYICDKANEFGHELPEKVANQVKKFQADCLSKHVQAVSNDGDVDSEYMMYMTIAAHAFDEFLRTTKDDNINLQTVIGVCLNCITREHQDRLNAGIECNEQSFNDAIANTKSNLEELWKEAIESGYQQLNPKYDGTSEPVLMHSRDVKGPNGTTTYERYMQTENYITPADTMNLSRRYSNDDIGKIISDSRFNDTVNDNSAKCIRAYESRKGVTYSNILSHVFIIDDTDRSKYGELVKEYIGSQDCQKIIAAYGGGSAAMGTNSFQFMVTGLSFKAPTNFGLDVSGVVLIMGTTISCGIFSKIADDLVRATYNYILKNR